MTHQKARILAKRYSQIERINVTEIFSPAARYVKIRLLLAVAVQQILKRKIIDVENAFINAEVYEKLYVQQPEESKAENSEEYAFRLNKALSGLRQVSK